MYINIYIYGYNNNVYIILILLTIMYINDKFGRMEN